jgi:thiamine transport system ATP-binding protein
MLKIDDLQKNYAGKAALASISFELAEGEIVAVLGPSGSGKSTLLKVVAGLENADGGQVSWKGMDLAEVPVHQRGFGFMFQDYALFPHRDVAGNVAFGLEMAEVEAVESEERVGELLKLVGLDGFEEREVSSLSGGEQQRVALARAMAPKPRLLMLDEPLGSLDKALRERLLADLHAILQASGQTSLYVTHDQEEAYAIADRIVLLKEGRIAQMGTPQELYRRPDSTFVARFLGLDNLLEADIFEEKGERLARTEIGNFEMPEASSLGKVKLLLRPDQVMLGSGGAAKLSGEVLERRFRGPLTEVVVQVGEQAFHFDFPTQSTVPQVGERIQLSFEPGEALQVVEDEQ